MKKIKLGVVIFARTSSKRLPNKINKIINKLSLLEIVIKRSKKINKTNETILATSNNNNDKALLKISRKYKIHFFNGSLNNVLNRAQRCVSKYNLTHFIRVNADRPYLDYEFANNVLKKKNIYNYDLVTNNLNDKAPKGLTFELIKCSNFLKITTKIKKELENICDYYYKNKKKYKILHVNSKKYHNIHNINFAIDKMKDLKTTRYTYKILKNNYYSKISKISKILNSLK